jgi:Mn2+/Fe2+ NRAMP family transporter
VSALIALVIFWVKEAGKAMDWFAKVLGILMLLLTAYVAYQSHPPLQEALKQTFFPQKTSVLASITIVGGTVGGYISFAGAHRLLDAGIIGKEHLRAVNRGSVQGILLASLMRVLLFLAALGVVYTGVQLEVSNPAASVFKIATGNIGHYLFGWVLWSAAITSVVGSAYTSVSFIQTFHPLIEKHRRWVITGFILISTLIFTLVGKPVKLLVLAGALNGLILPVSLALMLMAASKKEYLQNYHHPLLLKLAGWMVVAIMSFLGIKLLLTELPRLWN